MDVDKIIRQYVDFLNFSYNKALPLIMGRSYSVSDEQSLFDWFQLNWEFLVERKLLSNFDDYLYPYGYGADYNGTSDRMIDPNAEYKYKVYVKAVNGSKVMDHVSGEFLDIGSNVDFFMFVSLKDGWYYYEPKFNYVLLKNDVVVDLDDVSFDLVKI